MASIHQNPGSPYWTASVRIWVLHKDHPSGGFWRRARRSTRVPLSGSKRDAMAVANELERSANAAFTAPDARQFYEQAVSRLLSAADIVTARSTTWAQWSADWLAEQRGAAKTLEKYRGAVARFTTHLGARSSQQLRHVTHSDCVRFYSDMEKSGLSAATCRQIFKVIRSCFHRAKLHGHVERNPADLVKLETESTGFQRKPFSTDEIGKILARIQNNELDEWRTACLFGLFYGLRLRDAIQRRFEEVSTEDEIPVLRFVPMKKKRKGRAITLPVIGELVEVVKGGKSGFITPALAKMSNPSKVFSRILKAAGVVVDVQKGVGEGRNQANKSFHSWRHTTNTMLSNNGVDIRLRQLISDHESESMNSRYTHPALASMVAALGPIASIVGK